MSKLTQPALCTAAAAILGLAGGVFNFQERCFVPAPQAAITVAAETATVVLLAVSVAWDLRSRTRPAAGRRPPQVGGRMR
jgi:hypothetical protein